MYDIQSVIRFIIYNVQNVKLTLIVLSYLY